MRVLAQSEAPKTVANSSQVGSIELDDITRV